METARSFSNVYKLRDNDCLSQFDVSQFMSVGTFRCRHLFILYQIHIFMMRTHLLFNIFFLFFPWIKARSLVCYNLRKHSKVWRFERACLYVCVPLNKNCLLLFQTNQFASDSTIILLSRRSSAEQTNWPMNRSQMFKIQYLKPKPN